MAHRLAPQWYIPWPPDLDSLQARGIGVLLVFSGDLPEPQMVYVSPFFDGLRPAARRAASKLAGMSATFWVRLGSYEPVETATRIAHEDSPAIVDIRDPSPPCPHCHGTGFQQTDP